MNAFQRLAKAKGKPKRERGRPASLQERTALLRMRIEARQAGATLTDAGRGGLPSSLVLGVMRRDGYTCTKHGDKGKGDCGGLGVHHVGGVDAPTSLALARMAHKNDRRNLTTICAKGHDEVHAKDRKVDAKVEKELPGRSREDPERIQAAKEAAAAPQR